MAKGCLNTMIRAAMGITLAQVLTNVAIPASVTCKRKTGETAVGERDEVTYNHPSQ